MLCVGIQVRIIRVVGIGQIDGTGRGFWAVYLSGVYSEFGMRSRSGAWLQLNRAVTAFAQKSEFRRQDANSKKT